MDNIVHGLFKVLQEGVSFEDLVKSSNESCSDEIKANFESKMRWWIVKLNGKEIDKVQYTADNEAEDVKKSLVDHDGYDPSIEVIEESISEAEHSLRNAASLHAKAVEKATKDRNDYVLTLLKGMNPKKMSTSDIDTCNDILEGKVPKDKSGSGKTIKDLKECSDLSDDELIAQIDHILDMGENATEEDKKKLGELDAELEKRMKESKNENIKKVYEKLAKSKLPVAEAKKEDKKTEGDVKPADGHEDPPLTKVEKEASKETPTDAKKQEDKKEDVKASEEQKESKTEEGKVPKDKSGSAKTIKDLKEGIPSERILASFSDEAPAKDLQAKTPNSRIEKDKDGKYAVIVKESVVVKEELDPSQASYDAAVQAVPELSGFNVEEVKKGLAEEQEHAEAVNNDQTIIAKIVLAHVKECPQYYAVLDAAMEEYAKSGANAHVEHEAGENAEIEKAEHAIESIKEYRIVRFFREDKPKEVIKTGLSLEDAQAHCKDPATAGDGWFDGYEKEGGGEEVDEAKKGKIKITAISCDWKENFTTKQIKQAEKEVGGAGEIYDVATESDDKMMIISSVKLTNEQVQALYDAGDLAIGDDVWAGDSVEDIVKQLSDYLTKMMDECLVVDPEIDSLEEAQIAEKGEKWMQGAFSKHKGALHKALHVPEDAKISVAKMKKALNSKNPKLRKRAQAAVNANKEEYGSLIKK